ncbi:hypothetical protein GCM10009735_47740 [Actinomadura chokoriensis]
MIDVETTGLDTLHDRIVEIAVHRLHADGSPDRSYSTVLHNDSGPGPTHVHGLTAGDLAGAPAFPEVAGDIAELLDGAVLVAHSAMFDSAMPRRQRASRFPERTPPPTTRRPPRRSCSATSAGPAKRAATTSMRSARPVTCPHTGAPPGQARALELDPSALTRVHERLATAWESHPTEQALLRTLGSPDR